MARKALRQHIPNVLTSLRILLVIPVAYYLFESNYLYSLALFLFAGISDAVDGYLARRFLWTSNFGAWADPLADKLIVGVVFVVLAIQGLVPAWLVCVTIGRDLIILCGAGTYRKIFGKIDIAPTILSKVNTVVQILALLLVMVTLLDIPQLMKTDDMLDMVFIIVGIFSILSGVDYVISWIRRARSSWRTGEE
jgi:cardiolipin synthase|tara:strand:- start:782 stop:1363 length:582 start_codon:yes stop_codon:yes gene_type:complete